MKAFTGDASVDRVSKLETGLDRARRDGSEIKDASMRLMSDASVQFACLLRRIWGPNWFLWFKSEAKFALWF